MVTILLPSQTAEAARSRWSRLGHPVTTAAGGPPAPLDDATADQVWAVPEGVFRSPAWAGLRVDLARAGRCYLVVFDRADTGSVVAAMKDGAFDVLEEGDADARWHAALRKAADNQRLWLELYAGRAGTEAERLVGRSGVIRDLRRDVARLGPTDVTVLLVGESGVGKERVAAAVHEAGRGGPLVTLNCAAMPRDLLEAELFGAEKGAFTGAIRTRPGLVEQARGGTLFLDEVGELDLGLQPKLLRFLETRRARRLGGEAEYAVSLRVIAATNRDLERAVAEGRFRSDLYYRLAEVVLRIPPLRERTEDIPDLARVFLSVAGERFGKHVEGVEPELLVRFQGYRWPGNVRELKAAIDRLVLFHDGPVLRAGWWEAPVGEAASRRNTSEAGEGGTGGDPAFAGSLPSRSARLELAKRLLAEGRLPLTEIAARAGVHPTTLFRWRKSGRTGA